MSENARHPARPVEAIPDTPGSYQFLDGDGRIIYVGKAKNLRSRINSYFGAPRSLHPRIAQMVATAKSVEWVQVATEVEALMVEYSLIQTHRPRFNVKLRDDKSYPFLAVTTKDTWPRATVTRGKRRRGNRYFGPYGHAHAIRQTLDLLLRTFPVRTCSDSKFKEHERLGRPCLLFHIEQCAGPCVGEVSADDYAAIVKRLVRFLEGDTDEVVAELNQRMANAASAQEFELAARIRDRLGSVERAIETQQVAGAKNENFDVIGVSDDELEAAVSVLFVRRGRVTGQRGMIVDKAEPLSQVEIVERVITEVYVDDPPLGLPASVFVPEHTATLDASASWLSERRGTNVEIRVPQRGAKRALMKTATTNAADKLMRHRLKRGSDHNSRARALNELAEHLGLRQPPLRIECYDMSHLQGSDYVGSMVVFEDALPRKSDYRRFAIRDVAGNDDYAAMAEVLSRRLSNYLRERELQSSEQGKFSYPPQLLLVDGGKGQLAVAIDAVRSAGLEGQIETAAIAKQLEEVFRPGRSEPLLLPRQSEALYLLQRLRDESHRFAVRFHRERRAKRLRSGALDDVAGLGPTRRKRLLAHFGGVGAIKAATHDQLAALTWLPEPVADALYAKLHGEEALAQAKRDLGASDDESTCRPAPQS